MRTWSKPHFHAKQYSSRAFRFSTRDFALCTGRESDSKELRGRFLALYQLIKHRLKHEPLLSRFLREKPNTIRGVNTWSPYVPYHNNQNHGYKREFWVGLAVMKTDVNKIWDGVQIQFGINRSGPAYYGIWLENKNAIRGVVQVLKRFPPQSNYQNLVRNLSGKYTLDFLPRGKGYWKSIPIGAPGSLGDYITFERELAANNITYVHIGKDLTRRKLLDLGHRIVEDIVCTMKNVYPVYEWWSDLGQSRHIRHPSKPPTSSDGDVKTGERIAWLRQRIGQGKIRNATLMRYSNTCALCDINESGMLIASHIAPWSKDEKNRGNPRNLICLCLLHDKMFEMGYVFFENEYRVAFSREFLQACKSSDFLKVLKSQTSSALRMPNDSHPSISLLRKHRNIVD